MALVGDDTNTLTVEGRKIEAQYLLANNNALLVMTDDNPFEERLNIHLIGDDKLLDTLEISPPYQSMIIEDSQATDDRTISLTINDEQFIIQTRTVTINLLEKLKLLMQDVKVGKKSLLTFQKR